MEKISRKNWALIWILGMAGQLCWNVENAWFNSFVYAKIAPNPDIISWMVGVSAAVTTFATFLIGTMGDRRGKRKPFIAIGYILWGIFTIAFGVSEFLPIHSVFAAGCFVVGMDAIMSFFGSVGYDSGFCAWTTDISNETNRGQVGGAFATMPVLATIFGSVVSGIIIDRLDFFAFFIMIGGLVTAIGVFTLFTLKDAPALRAKKDPGGFWRQFFSVFRYRTVRENRELFWVFVVMMVYFIGFNVYFPYVNIYFVNYLGMDYTMTGLIQGVSLLAAVGLTIPAARLIDRGDNIRVIAFALLVNTLGLVTISMSGHMIMLAAGMLLTGAGYVVILQTLTAWYKNLYPEEQRGQFEGIKQLFFVCIPMIIGPMISNYIITYHGTSAVVDGVEGSIPNEILFAVSSVLTLATFLPMLPAGKLLRKRKAANRKGGEESL
ncbi:MFS family permease [Anaerotaenia torta]|uniref:MFS transporter n=1 Tax=Anaerotaenia torta TaxID=433293 RepID=UPI003D1DE9AF